VKKLRNISDIRRFFHRNETPIYFISATNFNLLGISEWVKNFRYINYIDCFDGRHPNVFIPSEAPHREFESIEDIVNYLIEHKEVIDYIGKRGGDPKAVFLMFDEKTEALCKEVGLDVWFPPAELRTRVDNKIETVRIGDRAGVPSVPNVLAKVESYQGLQATAREAGLGDDLVLQSAFGDSGNTTWFIASESDYRKYADKIEEEPEIKIMKRVNVRGSAIEACTTSQGTIVGPLMTELVGFKELTSKKGGWCGNEIFADSFTQEIRDKARDYTFRFGEALRAEGYRGYFELDFLIDQDLDDQPRRVRARRRAAVPVPPARVQRRGVRDRRRRAQRALVGPGQHRQLEPAGDQAHREQRRPPHRRAAVGHLAPRRRRRGQLQPLRLPPARGRERARGLLPAHQRPRRLPLRGCRPRHPDHPRPADDR